MIVFAVGQSSATFNVPIIDHGVPTIDKRLTIALFGAHTTGMG